MHTKQMTFAFWPQKVKVTSLVCILEAETTLEESAHTHCIKSSTCVNILLYGCESWVISQDMENKFATSCYRVLLNIKCIDHVLNTTMTNTVSLIHLVRHHQLKFLGHILRMLKEEPARRYALYILTIGKRRPGHPHTLYLTYFQRLLGDNEGAMQEQQIVTLADDRRAWRNLVVACSTDDGWWWWWNVAQIAKIGCEKFLLTLLSHMLKDKSLEICIHWTYPNLELNEVQGVGSLILK